MMTLKEPMPTNGSFEMNLDKAPEDWPYILPHLYAVNMISKQDQPKVEVVGFWLGQYRLTEIQVHSIRERAIASAKELFEMGVVKYLMHDGELIAENDKLRIVGEWPQEWAFTQIRDIGVFLCYLQSILKNKGENKQALQLREMITPAWPPTEIILVFQRTLQMAEKELAFDGKTKRLIKKSLDTIEQWLKGW